MLENPDGCENCVSLWSGVSDKDITECPVTGRAYEVYAKRCPIVMSETRVVPRNITSLTVHAVGDFLYVYNQKGLK